MPRNRHLVGLYLVVLALGNGSTGWAGPINSWAGATASVEVFDQASSGVGATASRNAQGEARIPYENAYTGRQFTAGASGSAVARATGWADGLLRVTTSYQTNNPGTRPHILSGSYPVTATAGWTGERVTLQAGPGAVLPDSVRITLGVEFRRDYMYDGLGGKGVTSLRYNGQELRVSNTAGPGGYWPGYTFSEPGEWGNDLPFPYRESDGSVLTPPGFDSLTVTREQDDYDFSPWVYHGTFHFDLPVGKDGVSDPFDLVLTNTVGNALESNVPLSQQQDFIASIQDITLTDGRTLSQAHLSGSLASGLVLAGLGATPIPEPTPLAAWGAVSLLGWYLVRKRPA